MLHAMQYNCLQHFDTEETRVFFCRKTVHFYARKYSFVKREKSCCCYRSRRDSNFEKSGKNGEYIFQSRTIESITERGTSQFSLTFVRFRANIRDQRSLTGSHKKAINQRRCSPSVLNITNFSNFRSIRTEKGRFRPGFYRVHTF